MMNKIAFGTLCVALGLLPALASAASGRATFSGAYTVIENRTCMYGGNTPQIFYTTGRVYFSPAVGSGGSLKPSGTTKTDALIVGAHAWIDRYVYNGTFKINKYNNMYWTFVGQRKSHLTFGRVEGGIAQTAVVVGREANRDCYFEQSLTRIGDSGGANDTEN
jgi:hypothetical protein